MASRISAAVKTIVFGNPETKSRPRTSASARPGITIALPIEILICSAVRSPIAIP